MKLRSLCISLVAAASLASVGFTSAFAADPVAVAVVNIQEIMRDASAAKSVKDQIEGKQKAFQTEMSKKEEDLQKEEQSLAKQRTVLSPEAFDKKVKDFKTKANAAQKDVQGKRAELDGAFSSALGEIQKSVLDIVGKIAKDKGYSVVVPSSQTLYFDAKLDITKDVLAKLNETLPKVSVNFKAAAPKGDE